MSTSHTTITLPETASTEAETAADMVSASQAAQGNNARATWPISLHNMRNNIAHMRPEAKQILVDCFLWAIQHDVTKPELAAAIGTSDNVLYKIITGRYVHPTTGERLDLSPKMEEAMRRWIADQRARQEIHSEFIVTPTAKKVFLACRLAQESRTPVFLYGPSHIGKTWALEHFAQQNNHGRTIYVRLGAASGLGGILRELAKALGVSYESSKEKMIQCIRRALVADMLVIFDEVHQLLHTYRKESFFACIEVLRELHDRVGCGMVFCVTRIKWDEFSKHRKSDLEQMFKRGVHRVALGTVSGQPLKDDLNLILGYHGLPFPSRKDTVIVEGVQESPYEVLRQLSKEDGLKSITERIRYAAKIAGKSGSDEEASITWADFTRAHLIIKSNATEADDWS